jgi:c-di-GMP-binding flagellar brake protein YcgR
MKDMQGAFEEKRKSPRFRLGTPVEYRTLRGSPETKRGSLSRDISIGGVRFITEEFLSLTARLVLDVTLPLPERPFSAVSKIAWIHKLPAGDKYEVGTQFLEISKDDKNRLSNYLGRLSMPSSPAR